jgi:hypothetical protein
MQMAANQGLHGLVALARADDEARIKSNSSSLVTTVFAAI